MQEQYITEKCFNKLNDIMDRLHFINSSFITSVTINRAENIYYYSLYVRYFDGKAPVQINIDEEWVYTEPFYSLLGYVIDEICEAIKCNVSRET